MSTVRAASHLRPVLGPWLNADLQVGAPPSNMRPISTAALSPVSRIMKAFALGISMVCVAACDYDDVWVLPEAKAIAIVREEMTARGIDAADTTRVVEGLEVCAADSPCRTVSLALDGWDDDERVGFAYITSAERGLPPSTAAERDEAEALQAELDARAEDAGIIVVFREWAHETESLAIDQFRRAVRSALDDRAL